MPSRTVRWSITRRFDAAPRASALSTGTRPSPTSGATAWTREPLVRLRTYLTALGVWSEAEELAWRGVCNARVDEEVNAYLAVPPPPVTDMFDHLYETLPLDLAAQREDAIDWEGRR